MTVAGTAETTSGMMERGGGEMLSSLAVRVGVGISETAVCVAVALWKNHC